jgi:hypothetical protein
VTHWQRQWWREAKERFLESRKAHNYIVTYLTFLSPVTCNSHKLQITQISSTSIVLPLKSDRGKFVLLVSWCGFIGGGGQHIILGGFGIGLRRRRRIFLPPSGGVHHRDPPSFSWITLDIVLVTTRFKRQERNIAIILRLWELIL